MWLTYFVGLVVVRECMVALKVLGRHLRMTQFGILELKMCWCTGVTQAHKLSKNCRPAKTLARSTGFVAAYDDKHGESMSKRCCVPMVSVCFRMKSMSFRRGKPKTFPAWPNWAQLGNLNMEPLWRNYWSFFESFLKSISFLILCHSLSIFFSIVLHESKV